MSEAPAHDEKQQHSSPAKRSHCQIWRYQPEEPDAVDPELSPEPDGSLALDSPVFKDSEYDDADESSEPDDAEESHGVSVVVALPHIASPLHTASQAASFAS